MKRRALVAGNWKMNGSRDSNASLVHDIVFEIKRFPDIDVLVCPPAPYLDATGRQIEG
ncbi:MAG: triose-phosphate isomerase, partial [Pseudomonadota bacterium]|nr:triose-phosphate isomerase [Pseudomonadota bacterium]